MKPKKGEIMLKLCTDLPSTLPFLDRALTSAKYLLGSSVSDESWRLLKDTRRARE